MPKRSESTERISGNGIPHPRGDRCAGETVASSRRVEPKVIFVDQTAQLGGAELSLLDIVRSRPSDDRVVLFEHGPLEALLAQHGVDVIVHRLASGVSAVGKRAGAWAYAKSGVGLMRQVRAVAAEAADGAIFYANTPKAFVVSALASLMVRTPVVYHLRDILSASHFSGINRQLIIALTKLSRAHVIANSAATAEAFVAAGGSPTAISVIHNGFDPQPFDEAYQDRNAHRAELRRSLAVDEAPVVAVFGRLAEWKGQHLAIEAIRHLPGVHLMLVGEALFGEDVYTDRLRHLSQDPMLRDRVHWMGFRTDIPALMQAADVIVHCSTAPEPFGRVIVEAMLSRRPVIASGCGGAAEIVEDGKTGLLFQPNSLDELISNLSRTLSGQMDTAKMTDMAYQESRRRFDLASRTAAIHAVINRAALASTGTSWRLSVAR